MLCNKMAIAHFLGQLEEEDRREVCQMATGAGRDPGRIADVDDRRSLESLCASKKTLWETLRQHDDVHVRHGDIVVVRDDDGDDMYAEVVGVHPSSRQVDVAWLEKLKDLQGQERFLVDLETGERLLPAWRESLILTTFLQTEEDRLTLDMIYRRLDPSDMPEHTILHRRMIMDFGIIPSKPGELSMAQIQLLHHLPQEMPEGIFSVVCRSEHADLGKRMKTVLEQLHGGGGEGRHARWNEVMRHLPKFILEVVEGGTGTCVWCNRRRTLVAFSKELGMGAFCLKRYNAYCRLEKWRRRLLARCIEACLHDEPLDLLETRTRCLIEACEDVARVRYKRRIVEEDQESD